MNSISESSTASKFALILGALSAFVAILGAIVVNSGSGDAESEGWMRHLLLEGLGSPVIWVSLLGAGLAVWGLVVHLLNGIRIRVPAAALILCTGAFLLTFLLRP